MEPIAYFFFSSLAFIVFWLCRDWYVLARENQCNRLGFVGIGLLTAAAFIFLAAYVFFLIVKYVPYANHILYWIEWQNVFKILFVLFFLSFCLGGSQILTGFARKRLSGRKRPGLDAIDEIGTPQND